MSVNNNEEHVPLNIPPPQSSPHVRRSSPEGLNNDPLDDPYDLMLQRTGCVDYHHKLQDCFYDNGNDWRKCQKEMKMFRECMTKNKDKTK